MCEEPSGSLVQVEGRPGGKADTILGYDQLMQRFGVLAGNARQLQLARKKGRKQLDELLECAKASSALPEKLITLPVTVTLVPVNTTSYSNINTSSNSNSISDNHRDPGCA